VGFNVLLNILQVISALITWSSDYAIQPGNGCLLLNTAPLAQWAYYR